MVAQFERADLAGYVGVVNGRMDAGDLIPAHRGLGFAAKPSRLGQVRPGSFERAVIMAFQMTAQFERADVAGNVSEGRCRKIIHGFPPLRSKHVCA
jgi:hypothetical protein